ncbi:MAG: bactofilin family protein [Bacteroidota bacterium]
MSKKGTFISKQSLFTGDISANKITVAGEVVGDLTASSTIHIKSNAKVEGDLKAPKILLEEGSHQSGKVILDDSDPKISLKQQQADPKPKSLEEKQPVKQQTTAASASPKKKNKLW